jgi:hypothetical protein
VVGNALSEKARSDSSSYAGETKSSVRATLLSQGLVREILSLLYNYIIHSAISYLVREILRDLV